MADNPKSKDTIQNAIVILGVMAVICVAVYVFAPVILPVSLNPASTVTESTSVPLKQFSSETPTVVGEMPIPALTATIEPADTPASIVTLTAPPTYTPAANKSLPDLTVTGISAPKCVTDYRDTTTAKIVKITVYVRNIGRVATHSFGPFDVDVSLIFGETYYALDEWSSKFNGVIGSTNLEIANLNPNQDVALNIVVDLKGNRKFGVEAVANSGENVIPDANILNNKLRKFFSIYCY